MPGRDGRLGTADDTTLSRQKDGSYQLKNVNGGYDSTAPYTDTLKFSADTQLYLGVDDGGTDPSRKNQGYIYFTEKDRPNPSVVMPNGRYRQREQAFLRNVETGERF
jgi:hypothetical protein